MLTVMGGYVILSAAIEAPRFVIIERMVFRRLTNSFISNTNGDILVSP